MVTTVKFSNLFPVKQPAPIGNTMGLYVYKENKPVVPVYNKKVNI